LVIGERNTSSSTIYGFAWLIVLFVTSVLPFPFLSKNEFKSEPFGAGGIPAKGKILFIGIKLGFKLFDDPYIGKSCGERIAEEASWGGAWAWGGGAWSFE